MLTESHLTYIIFGVLCIFNRYTNNTENKNIGTAYIIVYSTKATDIVS